VGLQNYEREALGKGRESWASGRYGPSGQASAPESCEPAVSARTQGRSSVREGGCLSQLIRGEQGKKGGGPRIVKRGGHDDLHQLVKPAGDRTVSPDLWNCWAGGALNLQTLH